MMNKTEMSEERSSGAHEEQNTICLGIPFVDELIGGGLNPGKMMLVTGRSSSGKTTFAVHVAAEALKAGRKVLFASFEMGDDELMERVAANHYGVSVPKSCEEWKLKESLARENPAIAEALEKMKMPLRIAQRVRFISESERGEFFRQVRLEFRNEQFDLLIVDCVHMIDGEAIDERENIMKTSRGLKRLAMDLGISVLATEHLFTTRENDDLYSSTHDLKERRSLLQDSDFVLLLDARDVSPDAELLRVEGEAPRRVKISKNRSGKCGTGTLWFNFLTSKVCELFPLNEEMKARLEARKEEDPFMNL